MIDRGRASGSLTPVSQIFPHRVAFVHGAPGPHPLHAALARSIGADFIRVDRFLPYYSNQSRLRRYVSWLVNAARLPRDYDLYLTEGTQVPPILLRTFSLQKRRHRIAALMADQTLYFLKANRYGGVTRRLLLRLLASYDALICMGGMEAGLAMELLPPTPRRTQIVECRTALDAARRATMELLRPNLESRELVFVGNGPDGWRAWYKGIDLVLDAMDDLRRRGTSCTLRVVGIWEDDFIASAMASRPFIGECVKFAGQLQDPGLAFSGAALYVQPGRGDAWPVSVLEAMCAGLPALVSELTGSRDAAGQVDRRFVVAADATAIADGIEWYFGLSTQERCEFSVTARRIAADYSETEAFAQFSKAIATVLRRPEAAR